MAEEPLQYQSTPNNNAHRMARLMLFVTGLLYLLLALAVVIGMIVSAHLDRESGSDFTLENPKFYLFLFLCTSIPASIGLGFIWAGGGITKGVKGRIKFGKYLAMVNLAFFGVPGISLVAGLVEDRPVGTDLILAALLCTIEFVFLAALVLTIWCLERSLKQVVIEKEPIS